MTAAAILVLDSQNAKIGARVAATYASIKGTCPASCPLRGAGCYAQDGRVAMTVRRLDEGATDLEALAIAREEANAIDAGDPDGRPLRIHVSGDCSTAEAARIVSGAGERWTTRGGGEVWSYTHAWREVSRASWGKISILASVDGTSAGAAALARGYAPAAVTGPHPMHGRAYERDGVRWIPCPNQTRKRTCEECRLCWDAGALAAKGEGIAFSAHSRPRRVLQLAMF